MSGNVYVKGNIQIGSEGEIVVLIQSWSEPSADEVDAIGLDNGSLHHYPYCSGNIKAIKITDEKKVLFCNHCGLRLPIPSWLKNINDLRGYLENFRFA